MLKNFLLAGIGGMIGSMLRYACNVLIHVTGFPWATFLVNIAGCFIIGIVFGISMKNPAFSMGWRIFLATGICGGFTTFSAFAYENIVLLRNGQLAYFLLYTFGSILLGFAATWMGFAIVK